LTVEAAVYGNFVGKKVLESRSKEDKMNEKR
jgi:hypothetical protein